MFHLDDIEEALKSSDDKFTIIKGDSRPEIKGNIYLKENSKLVSKSFGKCDVIEYEKSQFETFYKENKDIYKNHYFTPCYEGPHVKIWYDDSGEIHFSNDNKIDCTTSFWGNKEETFGKLFFENGGQKFVDKLTSDVKRLGYTHHFMIINKSLVITSRIDLRNNDTIIVYLGTTSLDGKIFEITFLDPEVHFYNHDKRNVFPSKEELAGRIIIPTKLTVEEAFFVLNNGYESNSYNPVIQRDLIKGECVIFRNGYDGIVKFNPPNYQMRSLIAGTTPNVKSRLYNLLEKAKNKETYEDQFPVIGCLDDSKLEIIKQNDKRITTFVINTFIEKEKNYSKDSLENRMNNILVICLLCCPLPKIDLFIDAWMDYKYCRDKILKFIVAHSSNIRNEKYDDKLNFSHQKALLRLKDLAKTSKNYANNKRKGNTYNERMVYSLKGLLQNEFGSSLYRIEKAITFIQE